jgi:hypothetical protein
MRPCVVAWTAAAGARGPAVQSRLVGDTADSKQEEQELGRVINTLFQPLRGLGGLDHHVHQAAASDQGLVGRAHDREAAEGVPLVAGERGAQDAGRRLGRARPASGIEVAGHLRERG